MLIKLLKSHKFIPWIFCSSSLILAASSASFASFSASLPLDLLDLLPNIFFFAGPAFSLACSSILILWAVILSPSLRLRRKCLKIFLAISAPKALNSPNPLICNCASSAFLYRRFFSLLSPRTDRPLINNCFSTSSGDILFTFLIISFSALTLCFCILANRIGFIPSSPSSSSWGPNRRCSKFS